VEVGRNTEMNIFWTSPFYFTDGRRLLKSLLLFIFAKVFSESGHIRERENQSQPKILKGWRWAAP
jgi:hypothetical protein